MLQSRYLLAKIGFDTAEDEVPSVFEDSPVYRRILSIHLSTAAAAAENEPPEV